MTGAQRGTQRNPAARRQVSGRTPPKYGAAAKRASASGPPPSSTTPKQGRAAAVASKPINPWNALWAMLVGFFMILVDSTIVAVANPSIMEKLGTDYDTVIWVTSAYLLAYAVPLLLAGRLGDRFGPKNLYIAGLVVFTLASLWCGVAGSIGMLIAARVVQGLGAALLTPQTLSTITRIFPPERRGVALSVWGATAGVATLVGPLAGGVLVDQFGWQWIFIVNVPIGIIGVALAVWLIPVLPTEKHGFDVLGVLLSGLGMFLIVFALQEGQSHDWALWIWGMVVGGVVFMAAFVYWQAVNTREPLIPLSIFRDRDFSLSNIGIAVIGFVVTAMILPVMFYAQSVCGLSPTRAALLTGPMAIATGVLAPFVGKLTDRAHPRPIIGFGFSVLAISLTWLSIEMDATTPIWRLVLPLTATGVGMAFIWAPLAATATRNLPAHLAGAGSGVYNATRQVGTVLGSAGMAAFMTTRIGSHIPGADDRPPGPQSGSSTELPGFLREPFAAAMAQSLLLPAFVGLFGVIAALFLIGFGKQALRTRSAAYAPGSGGRDYRDDDSDDFYDGYDDDYDRDRTDVIPLVDAPLLDHTSFDSPYRREYASSPDLFGRAVADAPDWDYYGRDARTREHSDVHLDRDLDGAYLEDAYLDDDDDYVEFVVTREPEPPPVRRSVPAPGPKQVAQPQWHRAEDHWQPDEDDDYRDDDYDDDDYDDDEFDDDTEPLATRVEHPRHAPADVWHSDPVESWHSLLDEAPPPVPSQPSDQLIGHAHNGFHVDNDHYQTVPPPRPAVAPPQPAAPPPPPVAPPPPAAASPPRAAPPPAAVPPPARYDAPPSREEFDRTDYQHDYRTEYQPDHRVGYQSDHRTDHRAEDLTDYRESNRNGRSFFDDILGGMPMPGNGDGGGQPLPDTPLYGNNPVADFFEFSEPTFSTEFTDYGTPPSGAGSHSHSRHELSDEEQSPPRHGRREEPLPPRARHYREEPDDAPSRGRHSHRRD